MLRVMYECVAWTGQEVHWQKDALDDDVSEIPIAAIALAFERVYKLRFAIRQICCAANNEISLGRLM